MTNEKTPMNTDQGKKPNEAGKPEQKQDHDSKSSTSQNPQAQNPQAKPGASTRN